MSVCLCVCVLGMRVGLCVCRVCWCRVGQSVSSQGVSMQVMSMCVRDGEQVDRELDRLWGSR